MHESEKSKWSRSVVSDPQQPHGLQPIRLLHPWDFPGKSTGVGCHYLLHSTHTSNCKVSVVLELGKLKRKSSFLYYTHNFQHLCCFFGFRPEQFVLVLCWTLTGYSAIQLNSDIVYLKLTSDPISYKTAPHFTYQSWVVVPRLPIILDDSYEWGVPMIPSFCNLLWQLA